nr:uncharacterized mitochondrial protein AtMg00810-like [Tanacetum cinerariifolium]
MDNNFNEKVNTVRGNITTVGPRVVAEAVNTACDVQIRVLVIKPHNKTPCKLFQGRKHALSFMRPFGCHVTILNTIDHLDKFDGMANEGFFARYSSNSKAFRVFNSRSRIVEEKLHVKFRNQSNGSTGKARVETVPNKDYILLPLWTLDLLFSSSSKDSPGDGFKPSGEEENKDTEGLGNEESEAPITEEARLNQEKDSVNNTNIVNAVGSTVSATSNEVNAVGRKSSIKLLDDLNDMEDNSIFEDSNEDVFGAEADLNNMETTFQGTQDEGIDYDEVFAPVARIEAITLFLAYASFKDFVVYQMDVKSAFLYGKIEEKTASTPMETSKPLMKDENAKDVNVHLYRSMIGSLMYLTSSMPDIMFAVCACARFQVTPKFSHLYAMKRIFRYLKGQPKLGLWYPKDSPFDLEAYTDSDYVGASLDRKSTTGGCQFLGSRLISWQCKKQSVVANSTTEVECVAAAN